MNNSNKKHFFGNIIFSFVILIIFVMIASFIGNALGWQVAYSKVNSVTGAIEKTIVSVANLFSPAEMKVIIGNTMTNFIAFAPLGAFLIAAIGIGVAHKSGLLTTIFTIIGRHLNKFWMTYIVALLSIISSFAGDASFVIVIPLAAILYLSNNRNPLGGILTSFVGISAGQGINFVLSSFDYDLSPYTTLAAKLTDTSYLLKSNNNIFFCIVAVIALSFLITYITEKLVVPNLPKYRLDEEIIEEVVIGRREKRGFILAGIGGGIVLLSFIYMLIPGLPRSGILLDSTGKTYVEMLHGVNSYFSSSIVFITSIVLTISGCLYGFGARNIKTKEDLSKTFYNSLNNIGGVLILLFFASQFIAIFKRSNLGVVITAGLVDLIKLLNFSSIPLILLVFILICISTIFLASSVTKWSIVSPIVVPLFMGSNMTAAFAQAVFRVSESAANVITPLAAYFIIVVGYLEIYNKGEKRISFADCYKMLWPYALAIFLLWIFIIIIWYIIGLPIGFGVYPTV